LFIVKATDADLEDSLSRIELQSPHFPTPSFNRHQKYLRLGLRL